MAELRSPVIDGSKDREVEYHNGNPDHRPIPALKKPGSILMRLVLDDEEREAVFLGNDMFVEILGEGIQPIRFVVGDREVDRKAWEEAGY